MLTNQTIATNLNSTEGRIWLVNVLQSGWGQVQTMNGSIVERANEIDWYSGKLVSGLFGDYRSQSVMFPSPFSHLKEASSIQCLLGYPLSTVPHLHLVKFWMLLKFLIYQRWHVWISIYPTYCIAWTIIFIFKIIKWCISIFNKTGF